MRKTVAVLPAMLLMLVVTQAQDKTLAKPNDAADKMLIANERALHDAVARADKASFRSLIAVPDGAWTSKQGFIPMELLANGLEQFELTTWDIVNPRVTWIDEDSAMVRSVWTGTGKLHGQPLASPTLATTVWVRRNGKWLALHHQQTDLIKN
jgi:hypothetical protein